MTDNCIQKDPHSAASKAVCGKKPYQKPSFRYEHVFETAALICGKIAGTEGNCSGHQQSS